MVECLKFMTTFKSLNVYLLSDTLHTQTHTNSIVKVEHFVAK